MNPRRTNEDAKRRDLLAQPLTPGKLGNICAWLTAGKLDRAEVLVAHALTETKLSEHETEFRLFGRSAFAQRRRPARPPRKRVGE